MIYPTALSRIYFSSTPPRSQTRTENLLIIVMGQGLAGGCQLDGTSTRHRVSLDKMKPRPKGYNLILMLVNLKGKPYPPPCEPWTEILGVRPSYLRLALTPEFQCIPPTSFLALFHPLSPMLQQPQTHSGFSRLRAGCSFLHAVTFQLMPLMITVSRAGRQPLQAEYATSAFCLKKHEALVLSIFSLISKFWHPWPVAVCNRHEFKVPYAFLVPACAPNRGTVCWRERWPGRSHQTNGDRSWTVVPRGLRWLWFGILEACSFESVARRRQSTCPVS